MRRSAYLGAAFCIVAQSAHAQGISTAGAQLNAQGFPERRIDVAASASLSYDSNVLRGYTLPGRDHQSDIVYSPALELDIVQPISRQDLFLSGSIGYRFYQRNSRLNKENINLEGGGDLRLSNCSARPSVYYARGLSDLGDLIGTNDTVNVQETVNYGVDGRCGGISGLTVSGGYHHETIDNTLDSRRSLDIVSDTYSGSVGLTSRSLGTISVYATYNDGEYPNRFIFTGTGFARDGIRTYSAGVSYERNVGVFLHASGSVGFSNVKPRASGVAEFKGLSYSGQIDYTRDPWRASLSVSRQAQQSNLVQSAYTITTQASAGAEYVLSQRVSLLGNAGIVKRNFAAVAPGLPQVGRIRSDDTTYYASTGARYRLTRKIDARAEVSYERRDADISLFDYNSTQFTLTLRAAL